MNRKSLLLAALIFPLADLRAGSADTRWSVELQTAQLFGVNNPENYHLSAQWLSLVYRVGGKAWTFAGCEIGPELMLSAVGEAVLRGPENHYFGGALRARLVFARPASRWSGYLESGGGIGAIDSTGTRFGQGQDLTFHLLFGAGARYAVTERCTVDLGILYQHLSNADLSEPKTRNTGLDAFGPSVTVGFAF